MPTERSVTTISSDLAIFFKHLHKHYRRISTQPTSFRFVFAILSASHPIDRAVRSLVVFDDSLLVSYVTRLIDLQQILAITIHKHTHKQHAYFRDARRHTSGTDA